MKLILTIILVALLRPSSLQIVAQPTTPVATPAATTIPTTPTTTPIATPAATARAVPSPILISTSPPPAVTSVPPSISPPPAALSPPPPPGAGSQKTAVLSVIKLTGSDLRTFNSTLGDNFIAAMADVYSIASSSIVIRNWGASGRRLLSDTVTVGSAALFPNGVTAASGLATLNSAANSGALQAAFNKAGLEVESLSLDSAVTALPSNFQPLYGAGSSRGLQTWAIVVIAVVGALVLVSIVLCCCRSCLCCCASRKEDGEEEKLPRMIKFGSMKGQDTKHFYNSQAFKPTSRHQGKPLEIPNVREES